MIPFEPATFAAAAATVLGAYVVFGITAFGAALFSVPILSLFFPLDFVLPVSVLLDVAAALAVGTRFSRDADRTELAWLAPFVLAGAVLGVTLLVALPHRATLAAFGVFVLAYGLYSLRGGAPARPAGRGWAPLAGLTGGVTGTLFGVGGPAYVIYLSRRLAGKDALRATLSSLVLLSVSIRALVFLASGLMLADRWVAFAMLLPFALAGLWIGNRIHGRVSREGLLRLMAVLLVVMGVSLVARALA
jgi:uncharacterized protein